MVYPDRKHWIIALDTSALEIVANLQGLPTPDAYRLVAEPCPKHGDRCVAVTYGVLLEHVAWLETDPGLLAQALLQTMLPIEPEPPPAPAAQTPRPDGAGLQRLDGASPAILAPPHGLRFGSNPRPLARALAEGSPHPPKRVASQGVKAS